MKSIYSVRFCGSEGWSVLRQGFGGVFRGVILLERCHVMQQ